MLRILVVAMVLALSASGVAAADQPQWGEAWTRNMVSSEKGLPDSFDIKTGKHVKWSAQLGTQTHSTPIVAYGRVYIGTNNDVPRDPKYQGDRGVLMCFDEKSGKFLWQLVVPKREEDPFFDWPEAGISSPATVEGDRVYIVSNRGEVMCLDALGMTNGNDGPYTNEAAHTIPRNTSAPTGTNSESLPAIGPLDADILWLFDLTEGAGIWSHDAAHSSILIHGDYLCLNTGTGVDNTHKRIRTPDAPSLVVLDKQTGRFVARDGEHIAPNIFHNTWCSPSLATVDGRPLIFFGAGNGILYAFDSAIDRERSGVGPQILRKVWQFDFDPDAPKTNIHKFNSNRREGPSNFYGMPVFRDDRIYAAGGGDLWWGKNEAWLKCIDATIHSTNRLLWSYALQKHVLSTPAVYKDMVFIADCGRKFHCVRAKDGKPFWTHDIEGEVWASPLVADGKVYMGTRSGAFYVFAAERQDKLLSQTQLDAPISATAIAANGVVYVATMSHLYALSL